MTEVEALLRAAYARHADDALDAVSAPLIPRPAPTRGRRLAMCAAAVAVVAIAGGVALTAHGPHLRETPSSPATGPVQPDAVRAVIISTDGKALQVSMTTNSCLGVSGVIPSETASTVSLLEVRPTPSGACGSQLQAVSATAYLTQPLGSRDLLDASTGTKLVVIADSSVIRPGWLPAGYTQIGPIRPINTPPGSELLYGARGSTTPTLIIRQFTGDIQGQFGPPLSDSANSFNGKQTFLVTAVPDSAGRTLDQVTLDRVLRSVDPITGAGPGSPPPPMTSANTQQWATAYDTHGAPLRDPSGHLLCYNPTVSPPAATTSTQIEAQTQASAGITGSAAPGTSEIANGAEPPAAPPASKLFTCP
jgi:hypothetical protein